MVLLWPQPQPTVSLQVPALPTPLNPKHVPVLIKAQRPDRSQVFVLKEPDEVTFEGGHSQTKAGKVLSQWSGHKRRRSGSHHSSKKVMPPPHSISINQAGPSDLKRLPGIGDAMAQRIIQDRQANGPFPSLPDLQRVKGIGPKKFEKMAPYLKL